MGRHSAPDDEEDGDVLVAAPVAEETEPTAARAAAGATETAESSVARGRHARAEDDEDTGLVGPQDAPPAQREQPAPLEEPAPLEQSDTAPDTRAPRVGKGNQSTAADLELLRERSDVRARVVAAVIAPFVVYTAVMFLVAGLDMYFIWVWLPLVTAGILAGSILDAAHRKRERDRPAG